jgi:hypothetical protein
MAFFDEKLKEKTGHRSGSGYLRNGFDRQIQTNYIWKEVAGQRRFSEIITLTQSISLRKITSLA